MIDMPEPWVCQRELYRGRRTCLILNTTQILLRSLKEVFSETQGNLLILTTIKFKKQVMYFQHIMAQNIHYHYRREWREYSEEILGQSKNEIHQGKLQILLLDSSNLLPALLTATHFSLLGWFTLCRQLSLAGIPELWHLQHLGISNTI